MSRRLRPDRDPLARRLLAERDQAEREIRLGNFTSAIDAYNRLSAELDTVRGRPHRPSPLVPVVLGRAGVHLIPAAEVPPELMPDRWREPTGYLAA